MTQPIHIRARSAPFPLGRPNLLTMAAEASFAFLRCHMCATPHSPHPRSASSACMLRGSASDQGKAKVTALRFKLVVTQALNTLFGEVGAALPVDLLGFDEPKQEAILRLPSKCGMPCMSLFMSHTLRLATMAPRSRARLWSALMLITDFEKKPCRVQVLAVAGSLSRLTGSPEWPRACAGHRRPPGLLCTPPASTLPPLATADFWHPARSLSIAGFFCRSTPRSCSRAPRARLGRISWPTGQRVIHCIGTS